MLQKRAMKMLILFTLVLCSTYIKYRVGYLESTNGCHVRNTMLCIMRRRAEHLKVNVGGSSAPCKGSDERRIRESSSTRADSVGLPGEPIK